MPKVSNIQNKCPFQFGCKGAQTFAIGEPQISQIKKDELGFYTAFTTHLKRVLKHFKF
jgi:hypothetical protein